MSDLTIKFSLNHMACPGLSPVRLVETAAELGMTAIELRNDVGDNSITDIETAETVGARARQLGIEILSINALYPFNIWNEERAAQAENLAQLAAACGATGLVCCPLVDASYSATDEESKAILKTALLELRQILEKHKLQGFIEPLGFPISSLRFKQFAIDTIQAIGAEATFSLVHDTFHHRGANESVMFPRQTGLVHVSGIEDTGISFTAMQDAHRLLVGPQDRLDSVSQVLDLLASGYQGYVSFEPFASEVHNMKDPVAAIRDSMDYMQQALASRCA